MKIFSTPFGDVQATFKDGCLASLKFIDSPACDTETDSGNSQISQLTENFLENYFKGKLLPTPPLLQCGTDFQNRIWRLLSQIPAGTTISYGELGKLYCQTHNKPRICSRAIGHAVGQNPYMILVPCHRVIRSNGSTGQYAGGSERKAMLLEHERRFFASKE